VSDADDVVCLGCGRSIQPSAPVPCSCPPPTIAPRSLSQPSSGHYRSRPPSTACPRCSGRLVEQSLHDAALLDCVQCGGLFLPKATIDALSQSESRDLRMAFPRRARRPEPTQVAYLTCPICSDRMNRVNFAKVSGVIVDICKNDGIWFDQGEVDAVIDFVEQGGLEGAKARERFEAEREKEHLLAELRAHREAGQRASMWSRHDVQISPGERLLLGKLSDWFRF